MDKKKLSYDLTNIDLDYLLPTLVEIGCCPGVYYRGRGIWRAHINVSGNFWGESETPFGAFTDAIHCWRKGGYILDGAASAGSEVRRAERGEMW